MERACQLYPQDFNLWGWLGENVERLVPLKGGFIPFPDTGEAQARKQRGARGSPRLEPVSGFLGKGGVNNLRSAPLNPSGGLGHGAVPVVWSLDLGCWAGGCWLGESLTRSAGSALVGQRGRRPGRAISG